MKILTPVKKGIRGSLRTLLRRPRAGRWIEAAACWTGHRFPSNRTACAALYQVKEALMEVRPGEGRVAVLPGGIRILVNVDDVYGNRLYLYGQYEDEITAFVHRWLRPGDVFFDVGANIGYYTCLAAALVGEGGLVHAFEPNPETYDMMCSSVVLNGFQGRVTLNQTALGTDGQKDATLFVPRDKGSASIMRQDWEEVSEVDNVKFVSLDDYCLRHDVQDIRILKVDVEGWEREVLTGGKRTLRILRPDAVVCEVNISARPGAWDVVEIMAEEGHTPFAFGLNGNLVTWNGQQVDYTNLCFLSNGREEVTVNSLESRP